MYRGDKGAGGERVTAEQAGAASWKLHGSHVVEGVVQLLADGLVLQFLGIQLIYCVVIIVRRQWRIWNKTRRQQRNNSVREQKSKRGKTQIEKLKEKKESRTEIGSAHEQLLMLCQIPEESLRNCITCSVTVRGLLGTSWPWTVTTPACQTALWWEILPTWIISRQPLWIAALFPFPHRPCRYVSWGLFSTLLPR